MKLLYLASVKYTSKVVAKLLISRHSEFYVSRFNLAVLRIWIENMRSSRYNKVVLTPNSLKQIFLFSLVIKLYVESATVVLRGIYVSFEDNQSRNA